MDKNQSVLDQHSQILLQKISLLLALGLSDILFQVYVVYPIVGLFIKMQEYHQVDVLTLKADCAGTKFAIKQ